MKGSRKSHNKLSFILQSLRNRNFGILQQARTEHRRNVVKKIGLVPHFHRKVTFENAFEAISCALRPRDTIPLFRGSFVVVVDAVCTRNQNMSAKQS